MQKATTATPPATLLPASAATYDTNSVCEGLDDAGLSYGDSAPAEYAETESHCRFLTD